MYLRKNYRDMELKIRLHQQLTITPRAAWGLWQHVRMRKAHYFTAYLPSHTQVSLLQSYNKCCPGSQTGQAILSVS